ncbi:hypothetical protein KC349_g306 [Hortaea werneckii]|nr:hypothetical protein KC349_g306 [Hortaea werneckii]
MRAAPTLGPLSRSTGLRRLTGRGSTLGGRWLRRASRLRRLRSFMTLPLSRGGLNLYPCFGSYRCGLRTVHRDIGEFPTLSLLQLRPYIADCAARLLQDAIQAFH